MAIVLPVFFLFIFALFEFGHALMVCNYLTSIAKQSAHLGSFEASSTADVQQFAESRLASVLGAGAATVHIKDAAMYETSNADPASVDISGLSAIDLSSAESRQLFLVRLEVPYESVSLLPPFWIKGVTLRGTSIMRRE